MAKPDNCSLGSWKDLTKVFVGITCPPTRIATVGGQNGLPPAWLDVPGHQSCLETFQASQHHTQWCLPDQRPEKCFKDTWDRVSSLFQGPSCLTGRHVLSSPTVDQPLQTVSITTPEYLKVTDYELCLHVYQVGTSAVSEYCLPIDKPTNCPDKSWLQLQRVFHGIGCGPQTEKLVRVGAPPYLRVASFRDCLGDHPSPTGSHSELCLPASKPEGCPEESWKSLRDPDVFTGVRCALTNRNGFGAPGYLLIPNFQDCLGTKSASWCLPDEKPKVCPEASWTQLKHVFEGESCSAPNIGPRI